jgi:fluoroacetyl-CoA thioesterase
MSEIPVGAKGHLQLTVTEKEAISFLGTEDTRVLATPWLIGYLEMTARNTVKQYLLDVEDTVGTQVNVKHLAATPLGATARFEAEVSEVNGRRIQFRVSAWDEKDQIAEGTHERAIINVTRFGERVAEKRRSIVE